MRTLNDVILAVVGEIEQEKEAANIVPTHALAIKDGLLLRISNRCCPELGKMVKFSPISVALQQMVDQGLLVSGRTINDTYYRLPDSGLAEINP